MCTLEGDLLPAEGAIIGKEGMLFDLVAIGVARSQPLVWITVQ